MISSQNCPSCFGYGYIYDLDTRENKYCSTCGGTKKVFYTKNFQLPPLIFSGNSPFPLAKD